MVDVNVNAPVDQAPTMAPPTRTDDQILPHVRWVLIGKSNCYLDVEKSQSNPIYKIAMDILKHTNFFIAFTASSNISSIYIQQFWDTGVVNRAHLDYAERIWEVFTQSIHTFIEDKKNLAQHTHGKKKATLIVIPSIRFTKLIIYHLQRKHKFHPRPDSPLHLPNEEPVLGYLKFSAKGTKREGFGMPIPGNLITADIQDESVAEGIPEKEPRVDDEEADVKRALEESLKSIYVVPRGPLPSVVIREPEFGKYQPLPEVQGKGKEKVTEEQVARDLLTLQTPKKKSPDDQCIFQRRTSVPTRSSGHDESLSLYAELGLMDSGVESDEDVLGINAGVQGEGQVGPNLDAQDEDQAGPNPDEQVEGQAGPNPGDAEASQPLPSPVVHAGSDFEHMDLNVEDVSTQPHPEQMDEGFTARLTRSFGDLFFNDKPSEVDNEKTTAETEAESMVSITIQQDTSSIPPMTTPHIGELEHIMANLSQDNKQLEKRLNSHGARLYTLENLDIPQRVSKAVDEIVTDAVDWAIQAPLRNCFKDLLKADMKEILHQKIWETNSYKTHEDHMMLYEALEKSMNSDHSKELATDLAEARKKKKNRHDSPKTPLGSPPHQPHPPPPPLGPSGASGSPGASGSSKVPTPTPPPPSTNQEYLQIDDDMALDAQAQSSDDEDIRNAHIPKVNLRQDWWKPLEKERPATPKPAWSISSSDMPVPKNNWASTLASTYTPPLEDSLLAQTGDIEMFIDWFYKRQGITKLKPQDLEGPAFKLVKVFHHNVIHLQYHMEECHKLLTDSVDDSILRYNVGKLLPLGGLPGQVTIQSDFFFNKDLEYLRYDSKGSRPALSISKMKAAYYPDVGLEQMVPDQMWIEEECKYDIAAMYGISHWWFQRQRFYIERHTSEGDRRAVRTHIWILSVVRIKVFSMYIHLVIRQRIKDFQLEIKSYQTQLNLTKPRWDATSFEYKHDYIVIDSLRAVTFQDRYGVQMIMRFNEIHKFSGGTLQQINEALDYRVKEFKVNRMNPGLNTRFWTRKDVDRSKEFMFAIQKRLKTRRIFRNLESFVGGRVRDRDYRLLKRIE
uniref:Histone deacetylase 14 n=1 Tax=Tanacetum cinerariifolium TaxID=118510 RepID=A0A6L2NG20_TANCI|nr:histone deacetylase 14 [Tanacetum cinerariifolium]